MACFIFNERAIQMNNDKMIENIWNPQGNLDKFCIESPWWDFENQMKE